MNNDKNTSERFEFVGELLNGEELLERLAAAQEVVSALTRRVQTLDDALKLAVQQSLERDKGEAEFYEFTARCASDLAQAGAYAHREKNEVILSVIYSLLNRRIYVRKERGYFASLHEDDVPF